MSNVLISGESQYEAFYHLFDDQEGGDYLCGRKRYQSADKAHEFRRVGGMFEFDCFRVFVCHECVLAYEEFYPEEAKTTTYHEGVLAHRLGYSTAICPYSDKQKDNWMAGWSDQDMIALAENS